MQFFHPPPISQQPVLRYSRLILKDQVLHLMVIKSLLTLEHSKSEIRQTNVYEAAQTSLCASFKYALNLLSFATGQCHLPERSLC